MLRFILVIYFLISFEIFSDEDRALVEWEKISGASAYLLEIKNQKGEIIFRKETKLTRIEIEINEGDYEKRISVINKFGEIEAISNWSSLKVKSPDGEIKVIQEWTPLPGAVYYILEIRDDNGKIIRKRKTDSTKLEIGLNPGQFERRITVINKLGEIEIETDWIAFRVMEIYRPKLLDENFQQTVRANRNDQEIIINGIHFDKDIEINFQKDKIKIPFKNLRVENENQIKLILNTENITPGIYSLTMKNPKSKNSFYPNYLKIEDSVSPEKLTFFLNNWEIFARSAVFPGWGEYFAGNKYSNFSYKNRGIIYSSLFVLASIYAYKTILNFNQTSEKFQTHSIANIAISAAIPNSFYDAKVGAILYSGQKILTENNELKHISREGQKTFQLIAAIYLIQLVDAFFINYKINEEKTSNLKLNFNYDRSNSFLNRPDQRATISYEINF